MKALNRVWAAALLGLIAATAEAGAAGKEACANPNAIGVSRTVEIDTTGGPGFGFEHYKANDFLQQKEVVLTFDDGPQKFSTEAVLAALADQCVKATFFSIGKMALGYPEIIREVAKAGHTVGTHTWSHLTIRKLKTFEEGRDEIERGASAVRRAVGQPIAPFFRYPTLQDTPEVDRASRQTQHRHVLDRHRQLRFQNPIGRKHRQDGDGQAREERQGHRAHARHP